MSEGNRRKWSEPSLTQLGISTSGSGLVSGSSANCDQVSFFLQVTTVTAGSITFRIQTSPDNGTTWFDLTAAEMTGTTTAISAAGNHRVSTVAPLGSMVRLAYTIVTGPISFVATPVFAKTGKVY